MLRLLGRIVMVPLGFLFAVMAAIAVALSLGLELTTNALTGTEDIDRWARMFELAVGVIEGVAAATVVPALLVIVVGEIGGIRSALYYVVGGGAAVAVLPLLIKATGGASDAVLPLRIWSVLATAGFAGGFVYWAIAGRRA